MPVLKRKSRRALVVSGQDNSYKCSIAETNIGRLQDYKHQCDSTFSSQFSWFRVTWSQSHQGLGCPCTRLGPLTKYPTHWTPWRFPIAPEWWGHKGCSLSAMCQVYVFCVCTRAFLLTIYIVRLILTRLLLNTVTVFDHYINHRHFSSPDCSIKYVTEKKYFQCLKCFDPSRPGFILHFSTFLMTVKVY